MTIAPLDIVCDGVESMSSRLVEILNTMPISHHVHHPVFGPRSAEGKARPHRVAFLHGDDKDGVEFLHNRPDDGDKSIFYTKEMESLQNGEPHKGVETLMRQSRGCLLPLRSSDIIILVSTKG